MAKLNLEDLSIEQLQQAIVAKKQGQIDELRAERSRLSAELRKVEAQLAGLTGAAAPRGRRGRRGGPSMAGAIVKMLADSGSKETTIEEMASKIGHMTSSDKPRIIISQALIRLKKEGLIQNAGRGVYKITAEGRKKAADS